MEIKAHCHDPATLRLIALELGAEFIHEERQRDTYFRVPEGRLKLRFIEVESGNHSELIRYYRTNRPGPCLSHYSIKPVRLPWLRRWWLSLRHGLLVEVFKLRDIWLWKSVRIHLDDVQDLGTFVELEALVDQIGCEKEAESRCQRLLRSLGISENEMIEHSYSDLLIPKEK